MKKIVILYDYLINEIIMLRNFIKRGINLTNRQISTISINGFKEEIVERSDYPINYCQDILAEKKVSIIGYGPQGRGQSLNLRDNKIDVCLGLRKGSSWDKALEDGWVEGKDLFEMEEACHKGNIIQYLLLKFLKLFLIHQQLHYLKSQGFFH